MIIGYLNRLITFERKATTTNATGNEEDTYSALFTAWASVQPMRGKETTQANELVASNFLIFKCRYDSRPNPKDRILYGSDYYDIKTVIELGYREGLEIMAEYKDNY